MEEKIFITLGSQKFQFNRLLIAVDKLCEKKIICGEDVFAQIGYSDYVPQNYRYNNFLDREEFSMEMGKADIVITHGGTGAIIGAVKKEKKVIAVPRLATDIYPVVTVPSQSCHNHRSSTATLDQLPFLLEHLYASLHMEPLIFLEDQKH